MCFWLLHLQQPPWDVLVPLQPLFIAGVINWHLEHKLPLLLAWVNVLADIFQSIQPPSEDINDVQVLESFRCVFKECSRNASSIPWKRWTQDGSRDTAHNPLLTSISKSLTTIANTQKSDAICIFFILFVSFSLLDNYRLAHSCGCFTTAELEEAAQLSASNKYPNSNCKHMHIRAPSAKNVGVFLAILLRNELLKD